MNELEYAKALATRLWERDWKKSSPQWKPLDDVIGVLSQISNMVSQPIPANEKQQPAIGDRRSEMLDYFAAHALQGLLSVEPSSCTAREYATAAYEQAEAMIKEREKWII